MKRAGTLAQRARLREVREKLERHGIDTGDLRAEEIMTRGGPSPLGSGPGIGVVHVGLPKRGRRK